VKPKSKRIVRIKSKPHIEPTTLDGHIEQRNDRTTGDLLAIDPSLTSVGAALYRGGVLIAAHRIRMPVGNRPIGARCLRMAQEILSWAIGCHAEPRTLALEWPQVYKAARSKGSPNDLIGLAGVGMAVAGALAVAVAQRNITLEVVTPTPAEWIGQLPKSTKASTAGTSPRAIFILGKLTDEESILVPTQHDVIDSVGIGLWALDRLVPKRVFAGAVG